MTQLKFPKKGVKAKSPAVSHNNITCKCVKNHIHRSRLEARVCNLLWDCLCAKMFKLYIVESKYALLVNDKVLWNHYPDFSILKHDDSCVIWEAKGHPDKLWKYKMKHFKIQFPNIPYLVIDADKYKKLVYKKLMGKELF